MVCRPWCWLPGGCPVAAWRMSKVLCPVCPPLQAKEVDLLTERLARADADAASARDKVAELKVGCGGWGAVAIPSRAASPAPLH